MTVIGDAIYADVELLGEGGMGRVQRATDSRLQRAVALKSLRAELAEDGDAHRRFLNEARCVGQLEHPGIPPVYELGEDAQGHPYFAMKLTEGETLLQVIDRLRAGDASYHSYYSYERRLQIGISVCDALDFAHSRGWLHRDVKPENVMVGKYGEVYLNDWGIAVSIGSSDTGPRAKQTDDVMGTVGFCPPEQLSTAEEIDGRADVFGLGATLYEFFTLRPAFPGPTTTAIVLAVLDDKEVAMADTYSQPLQGRVPREIAYVLRTALQKERGQRFPSARAFRDELQKVVDGEFPAVCLCTATKRSLGLLQEFVDSNRGLASALVIFWFIAPILLAVLMWYLLPRG